MRVVLADLAFSGLSTQPAGRESSVGSADGGDRRWIARRFPWPSQGTARCRLTNAEEDRGLLNGDACGITTLGGPLQLSSGG